MISHMGPYEILEELGRGGMGVVYKAADPNLGRLVAIKCLSDELADDERTVARFLREARSVAALSHPNCVRLYLVDEQDGMPFFVMEYVDGETLAEYLQKNGRCDPDTAARIIAECTEALSSAYARKILHRDVKPANIMLERESGRAMLADFGIAAIHHAGAEDPGDASRAVAGTIGYLAPELIETGSSDQRGDIFALGAVYYELLTGRRLVQAGSAAESVREMHAAGFPDLSGVAELAGDRTADLIARMVAVDPERRVAGYDELRAELSPDSAVRNERARQTAPTRAVGADDLARARQPRTQADPATRPVRSPGRGRAPTTRPIDPDGTRRLRRFGIVAAVLAGITLLGVVIAMNVGPGPENADPDEQVAEAGADDAADSGENAAPEPIDVPAESPVQSAPTAATQSGPEERATPRVSATEMLRELRAGREADDDPNRDQTGPGSPSASGTDAGQPRLAMRDHRVGSESAPVEQESTATRAPDPEPAPPPAYPDGIAVIGLGDGSVADPMAAVIEDHLRSRGRELVSPGFIQGLDRFLGPGGVDLAGIREPARSAGVRYLVVVKARPTGERELRYYGRRTVSYSAQASAVTLDLAERRQLASSPSDQIEYTSLNAAERARNAAREWIPVIDRSLRR